MCMNFLILIVEERQGQYFEKDMTQNDSHRTSPFISMLRDKRYGVFYNVFECELILKNKSQTYNHEVIVKHVRAKLGVRTLLIGQINLRKARAYSFIINSYYTIIKYKIVVKKDKRIQCF